MGTDALSDYQQLGQRLEAAAEQVRSRRSRRKTTTTAALRVPDLTGHPAEIVNPDDPDPLRDAAEPSDGCSLEPCAESSMPDGAVEPASAPLAVTPTTPADVPGRTTDPTATPSTDAPQVAPRHLPHPIDLAALEALLFSTRHPLTPNRLAELIDIPSTKALRHAVAELNRQYEATGRCFRVEQVAGGYQLLTLPEHGELLNRLHQKDIDAKLTRSALETLAIIAYKQPVLRAEVEAIRGVASGETIRSLMEKHLVKIAGRANEPGRPILYGTTKRFLELFGLNSLKDLPKDSPAPSGSAAAEPAATASATLVSA